MVKVYQKSLTFDEKRAIISVSKVTNVKNDTQKEIKIWNMDMHESARSSRA